MEPLAKLQVLVVLINVNVQLAIQELIVKYVIIKQEKIFFIKKIIIFRLFS